MSDDGRREPATVKRLGYIDWARGLAILIMIEAHVIDAWTGPAGRATPLFRHLMLVAGFAAPLFLFLAGVSVVLAAAARQRKTGSIELAAASVSRRGWEIFGLAFLFRLQSFLLSPGSPPVSMLKVDILNIMGPAIVLAATLWGIARTPTRRVLVFAAATVAVAMLTPPVRATRLLDVLPDPIERYLRPLPGWGGSFAAFPWAGFVFAGSLAGLFVEGRRSPAEAVRRHAWLGAAALAVALCGYFSWYLPSLYAQTNFWTTSPAFFFVRAGALTSVLTVAFFWERRPALTRLSASSPMAEFGRSSLFVYWVHVELVYGAISRPLHQALPTGWAIVGFAAMTIAMYLLAKMKDRVVARWRERQRQMPLAAG
jgi:uncharacterized membrane protein